MKYIYLLIFTFLTLSFSVAQEKNELLVVNKSDVLNFAKNKTGKTLLFTFSIGCAPSLKNPPISVNFAKKNNLNMGIIVVEKENSDNEILAIKYLQSKFKDITIFKIKNEYGKRINKKYKKFMLDITPSKFKNYPGYAKYILINEKGEVEVVTSYKDTEDYPWDDYSTFLKDYLLPFIK